VEEEREVLLRDLCKIRLANGAWMRSVAGHRLVVVRELWVLNAVYRRVPKDKDSELVGVMYLRSSEKARLCLVCWWLLVVPTWKLQAR
jgi:hypothetical protein